MAVEFDQWIEQKIHAGKDALDKTRVQLFDYTVAKTDKYIETVRTSSEQHWNNFTKGLFILQADVSIELLLYAAFIAPQESSQEELYVTYQGKLSKALEEAGLLE